MKNIKVDLFCCVILVIISIFVVGCDKKGNSVDISGENKQQNTIVDNNTKPNANDKQSTLDKSIALRMEIDELKNEKIKDIVVDKKETLRNGAYGCIDSAEGKYYILINGVDYWHSHISFSIKDKLLTISYTTEYDKGLRIKDFFLINPNNEESFDKVELINNGNKEIFRILYQQ
jgi:hypothetical protein